MIAVKIPVTYPPYSQAHYLFAKIRKLSHFLLLKIMMVEQLIISHSFPFRRSVRQ